MAIRGTCLCGGVRFEIDRAVGPFEICHCHRCRKVTGGAGLPAVTVRTADFHFLEGHDLVEGYSAPILYRPPAYRATFCRRCGSPVPEPEPEGESMEIAAGLFDDDLGLRPDKHIFVEHVPDWDSIGDDLPRFDVRGIHEHRTGRPLPEDFEVRVHGSPPDGARG